MPQPIPPDKSLLPTEFLTKRGEFSDQSSNIHEAVDNYVKSHATLLKGHAKIAQNEADEMTSITANEILGICQHDVPLAERMLKLVCQELPFVANNKEIIGKKMHGYAEDIDPFYRMHTNIANPIVAAASSISAKASIKQTSPLPSGFSYNSSTLDIINTVLTFPSPHLPSRVAPLQV